MQHETDRLVNQIHNILHQLDQHVAPADTNGKRLLHEAFGCLKELMGSLQTMA